jgi:phenylpropionate dioxygenase-like ring-hydroxylating dioxygenase large terminal subunit
MSLGKLVEVAKDALAHAEAGTVTLAAQVAKVPAGNYYRRDHWKLEMDRVFRRLPLMLACSVELPATGDYKAMNAGGIPVLITRNARGQIKAYVNSCAHRGSQIMPEGRGNARRFTCPYHAWSYNHDGELTHVYSQGDFGHIDANSYGLVELECLERSGLIWVLTDAGSELDIASFLCGYDQLLDHFGFRDWHFFDRHELAGPNWKIAYDGYLDFYHLPILHRDSFGADTPNQAQYYDWGPHQHVKSPQVTAALLAGHSEADWPLSSLLCGVWTIFPHVSIASFGEEGDCRGVLISQLFPGPTPETSYTVQNYLLEKVPDERQTQGARQQFELLKHVVEKEDYATGLKQQNSLRTGARDHVLFGRNEAGGQGFHRWLQLILQTDDSALNRLFEHGCTQGGPPSSQDPGRN